MYTPTYSKMNYSEIIFWYSLSIGWTQSMLIHTDGWCDGLHKQNPGGLKTNLNKVSRSSGPVPVPWNTWVNPSMSHLGRERLWFIGDGPTILVDLRSSVGNLVTVSESVSVRLKLLVRSTWIRCWLSFLSKGGSMSNTAFSSREYILCSSKSCYATRNSRILAEFLKLTWNNHVGAWIEVQILNRIKCGFEKTN